MWKDEVPSAALRSFASLANEIALGMVDERSQRKESSLWREACAPYIKGLRHAEFAEAECIFAGTPPALRGLRLASHHQAQHSPE